MAQNSTQTPASLLKLLSVLLVTSIVCTPILAGPAGMGSGAMPSGGMGSEEKEKSKVDPVTSQFVLPDRLDTEQQRARERSGKPGTLKAAKAQPNLIYEIRVDATKRVDPDAVLPHLTARVNEPIDKEAVAADIRRIYKMGFFKAIEVLSDDGPNKSLILTYKLEGKPIIFETLVEGAKVVDVGDITDLLSIQKNHVADVPRILEELAKVKELYVSKGFFLANISYELRPVTAEMFSDRPEESSIFGEEKNIKFYDDKVYSDDLVQLVILINENDKVRVEDIHFLGNEHIPAKTIIEHMRTRPAHPLGALTKWGTFNQEMFDIDNFLIQQLYQDHGYLEVKVGKPRVTLSPDQSRITIFIPINEGVQYHVGQIGIKVPKLPGGEIEGMTQEKLDDMLELEEGDMFNRTKIARSLMAVTDYFQNEGYAYANVNPYTKVDEKKRIVDIDVEVEPGDQIIIERINIEGNSKTMDEVIRREMRVYEGELFSSSMLRLSEMRINQLGYFESVKLSQHPGSSKDRLILDVVVVEKRTGQIQFGGGYASGGEGLMLQTQISQQNLFGRGQTLSAQVQWSGVRRIFDIKFVDPYAIDLGDDAIAVAFSAYNLNRNMGSFERDASGGDITFGLTIGKPLVKLSNRWLKVVSRSWQDFVPDFDNFKLFLTLNGERVVIADTSIGVLLSDLHLGQPRYTTAFRATLQFDQRNNRMMPSRGYFWELQSEIASKYLGSNLLAMAENSILDNASKEGMEAGPWYHKQKAGTNDFFRLNHNIRFYYSVGGEEWWKNIVFKANFNFGYIKSFGDDLIFENYMLGGIGTLRGYAYRSIGPVGLLRSNDYTGAMRAFVVGGNKQFFMNVEMEFPVLKALGLSGVAFFDAGNVFSPQQEWFYLGNKSNSHAERWDPVRDLPFGLYASAGIGLRWASPFGLIRIELGFPIFRRPVNTAGAEGGDQIYQVEFNVGPSF